MRATLGEHNATIDRETGDRVQAILPESPHKRAVRTCAETPVLLSCCSVLTLPISRRPKTRKGAKLYRYYVSQKVFKRGAGARPIGRVPRARSMAPSSTNSAPCSASRRLLRGPGRRRVPTLTTSPRPTPAWPCSSCVDSGTDGLNVRLRVDGLGDLAREMLADGIGEQHNRGAAIPETVTFHVPFRVVKCGGRKEMKLPDGAAQARRSDNTLVKALARAFPMAAGEFATIADLAECIAPYCMTSVLRHTLLAPDVVEVAEVA